MTMIAPSPLQNVGKASAGFNCLASTLESLVIECAMEEARSKELGSTTTAATSNPYEMNVQDYEQVQQLPGNDVCADCGSHDTEWASVTYGILICTSCSGQHRSLGTHISRVRSVKMDSWSEPHVQRMKAGGNGVWNDYLATEATAATSIREKYDSPVARKYQTVLQARMEQAEEEVGSGRRTSRSSRISSGSIRRSISPVPLGSLLSRQSSVSATPTITYLGRSFPASSIKCSGAMVPLSRNSSIGSNSSFSSLDRSRQSMSLGSSSHNNNPIMQPLMQALEQANNLFQQQPQPNIVERYTNHPVSNLFFSREDILEITSDKEEFERLKRSLRHNGAVTNQVVKQRMFAFVANRRKRKEQQKKA
ncbi:with ANK repeat and PH domain-containing protein cnt [Seminavis robusta]|uniref:With ANK repeat and PH domain-containing protein cnt n=1 Tax=Seminavis robusta TaxID=568900 RepID=A0A9N8F1P1_9STRA|nr:with ANK repeat and PH domain-containing protein cnt [Seminavis robusta]|eukprot:Sro3200_g345080.1 with ANK repeat and PH domain-containing protein cnt (365) ;mRNA; r:4480-5574